MAVSITWADICKKLTLPILEQSRAKLATRQIKENAYRGFAMITQLFVVGCMA
jgi:hypothetical protein